MYFDSEAWFPSPFIQQTDYNSTIFASNSEKNVGISAVFIWEGTDMMGMGAWRLTFQKTLKLRT